MGKLAAAFLLALMVVVAYTLPAVAGDIVTMPTANQMGPGEVDVAQYYVSFDYPPGLPEHAYLTTMYVGVTDRIEVDVWYVNPNKRAADQAGHVTVLNATGLVLSQRKGDLVDLVVGVRDIGDDLENLFGPDFDRGLFVAAAKTLNPPSGPPTAADCPIWRVHVGAGEELGFGTDLNRMTKGGVFGGIQAIVTPPRRDRAVGWHR